MAIESVVRHPSLEYIGRLATFYIPEDKHHRVRDRLHDFFIRHYNAYTFEASKIQGYWRRDPQSPIFDDANVRYVVSFAGEDRVGLFVDFLSDICGAIGEQCLYLTIGQQSFLVQPNEQNQAISRRDHAGIAPGTSTQR